HVRFGRMEKRFEERAFRKLLQTVETMTGKKLTETEILYAASGPNEEDLVNSGLEETMINSYQQIREIKMQYGAKADLRTAAFLNASNTIVVVYSHLCIFP